MLFRSITYASFKENGKKVKSLYLNGMKISENFIETPVVNSQNNELYIGNCLFKGAEISKILLYQKKNMDREYVEGHISKGKIKKGKKAGKMKSVLFPKGGDEKRSATRKDKIENSDAKAKYTRSAGYFSHEKKKGVINENLKSYRSEEHTS